MTKTCSRCGVSQPLGNFSKQAASPDGYLASCKPCTSEAKKRQRAALKARSDEEIEAAAALRPPRACRICKEVKTFDGFTRDRGRRDGRGTVCLICAKGLTKHYNSLVDPEVMKQRKAEGYRKNRATYRRYRLRYDFDLTEGQYDEMFVEQDGVCAICKQPETAITRGELIRLAVDHCHASGRIRQLLCAHCNHGLGHFKDSPDLLLAAAAYLEEHTA